MKPNEQELAWSFLSGPPVCQGDIILTHIVYALYNERRISQEELNAVWENMGEPCGDLERSIEE